MTDLVAQLAVTEEPARIRWIVGYTLNTGNFQSLRLDFDISESQRSDETTEEAVERIYKYAETVLSEKLQEAREELVK
jgi:hypothetical protein